MIKRVNMAAFQGSPRQGSVAQAFSSRVIPPQLLGLSKTFQREFAGINSLDAHYPSWRDDVRETAHQAYLDHDYIALNTLVSIILQDPSLHDVEDVMSDIASASLNADDVLGYRIIQRYFGGNIVAPPAIDVIINANAAKIFAYYWNRMNKEERREVVRDNPISKYHHMWLIKYFAEYNPRFMSFTGSLIGRPSDSFVVELIPFAQIVDYYDIFSGILQYTSIEVIKQLVDAAPDKFNLYWNRLLGIQVVDSEILEAMYNLMDAYLFRDKRYKSMNWFKHDYDYSRDDHFTAFARKYSVDENAIAGDHRKTNLRNMVSVARYLKQKNASK